MNRYLVTFWKGANNEEGSVKDIECLISDTVRKKLLTEPPKFINVIVDDGEEMILVTENINCMKQLYGKESLVC